MLVIVLLFSLSMAFTTGTHGIFLLVFFLKLVLYYMITWCDVNNYSNGGRTKRLTLC